MAVSFFDSEESPNDRSSVGFFHPQAASMIPVLSFTHVSVVTDGRCVHNVSSFKMTLRDYALVIA